MQALEQKRAGKEWGPQTATYSASPALASLRHLKVVCAKDDSAFWLVCCSQSLHIRAGNLKTMSPLRWRVRLQTLQLCCAHLQTRGYWPVPSLCTSFDQASREPMCRPPAEKRVPNDVRRACSGGSGGTGITSCCSPQLELRQSSQDKFSRKLTLRHRASEPPEGVFKQRSLHSHRTSALPTSLSVLWRARLSCCVQLSCWQSKDQPAAVQGACLCCAVAYRRRMKNKKMPEGWELIEEVIEDFEAQMKVRHVVRPRHWHSVCAARTRSRLALSTGF